MLERLFTHITLVFYRAANNSRALSYKQSTTLDWFALLNNHSIHPMVAPIHIHLGCNQKAAVLLVNKHSYLG